MSAETRTNNDKRRLGYVKHGLQLYFKTTRAHHSKCNINLWFSTRALKNRNVENNNNSVYSKKSILTPTTHGRSIFHEWVIFTYLVAVSRRGTTSNPLKFANRYTPHCPPTRVVSLTLYINCIIKYCNNNNDQSIKANGVHES